VDNVNSVAASLVRISAAYDQLANMLTLNQCLLEMHHLNVMEQSSSCGLLSCIDHVGAC